MILQTKLALGSTNFIGIMNQIHYIDNQFNLNFQPISLHIVNNFMIWFSYLELHKINFLNYELYFTKMVHHVRESPICYPWLDSTHVWRLSPTTGCCNSALQTRYVLYSHIQHSSHNQIYNHTTLSYHSNYTGFVLLALVYSNRRPKKNWHYLHLALMYYNQTPKKNRLQGWRLPSKHITKRNQWPTRRQRMRNKEARSWEYENHKVRKDSWSC